MKCHLKKRTLPTTWDVGRKDNVYITRPYPGGHTRAFSMSLNTLLKDVLKICHTKKEVKYLLQSKDVFVDGRLRFDEKLSVGLFDVISFPRVDQHYVISFDERKKLRPVLITKTEAKTKISRIVAKKIVRGGKVQINTDDGRTFIVESGKYVVGETIQFNIPDQKIVKQVPVKKGNMALLIRGRHSGAIGTIEEINQEFAIIKDKEGELLKTKKEYAFVVGEGSKSLIKLRA